jgi:hypothetical protein
VSPSCGGWSAAVDESGRVVFTVRGEDPFDGLRALCALTWPAVDAGERVPEWRKALAELGLA